MIVRRHLRALALSTGAILLLPALGKACSFETPRIKGVSSFQVRVVDYRQRPMEGAEIVLTRGDKEAARFKSDAHGEVSISALAPGLYQLWLDHDVVTSSQGYVLEVTKQSKGLRQLTFNWPDDNVIATSTLSGALHYWKTDPGINGIETSLKRTHGEGKTFPLAKAQLALFKLSTKEQVAETTTDDEGRFDFRLAEPGFYYVRFKFESYDETVVFDLDPNFARSSPFIDVLIEDFILCGNAPQYRSLWPAHVESNALEQQL